MTWVAEPNSALGWAACRRQCGGRALVMEKYADVAMCGTCAVAVTGAGVGAGELGVIGPVIASVDGPGGAPSWPVGWTWGEPVAHPPPAHTSRQPLPAEFVLPVPAMKLAEVAREYSWEVAVTYSRGWGIHGVTGKPTAERHVVGVRIGGHPLSKRQASAVYESPVSRSAWTWSSMWVWGSDLMFVRLHLLEELHAFLAAGGAVERAWVRQVRDRVAAQDAAKKARAALVQAVKQANAEGRTPAELCVEFTLPPAELDKIITKRTTTKKKEAG